MAIKYSEKFFENITSAPTEEKIIPIVNAEYLQLVVTGTATSFKLAIYAQVNNDNDFCYECYLPELLINHLDELEQQLFDLPFSHFRDCLTPLMQLKDGKWTIEKAIQYLDELRTEGYVDNSSYGLW